MDDLSNWLATQIKIYAEQERSAYLKYADLLQNILRQACDLIAPEASVEVRAKSLPSFAEKAIRKRQKYNDPVYQMTDLCGGRVITDTQEEVDRICEFIRKNFKVDPANSDDKAAMLGTSQFGYRSIHFVVQLSDQFIKSDKAQDIGTERKAEIQVRTGLENAWARVAHDRIYKSQFNIPDLIQREMNRASALLEEVDRDFALVLDSLKRYSTSQAFLPPDEAKNEIQILEMIYENLEDRKEKRQLALRIASAAKTLSNWDRILRILQPFASDQNAVVLREIGLALCHKNYANADSEGFLEGILRLKQALRLDSDDAIAHACLGWAFELGSNEQEARSHYAKAHQLDSHNPYYLMSYLEFQIAVERQFGSLSLGPVLKAAVEMCRKHAAAGIDVPRAQFTEAKLLLLLEQPYMALGACARGICALRDLHKRLRQSSASANDLGIMSKLSDTTQEESFAAGILALKNALENDLRSVRRMGPLDKTIQGRRWVEQLMQLAREAIFGNNSFQEAALSKERIEFIEPILIVSGGGGPGSIPSQKDGYLRFALHRFTGTVICSIVHKAVNEIVVSMVKQDAAFRSVGYYPRMLPAGMQIEKRHSSLVETEGTNFGPEEPLQMWSDLLSQGNHSRNVRLLGLGGGELASLEYQIAAALGARVGIIASADGTADNLWKEPFWNRVENLQMLPVDPWSISAFIRPMEKLKVDWLEDAARVVHEKYRQAHKHEIIDPSMVPYNDLAPHLRESSQYQVSYAIEILYAAGFGVRKAVLESGSVLFDTKEIELMAEMEHGRWNAERLSAGWKIGPRDPIKKQTPYLVPWSELPEEIRQWDRDAVIAFPEVLKDVGLEIYRLPKPESH